MKKTGSLGHWIVLLLLLAAVCGWSDTFCLVRDGAPLARIQQNPNPGPLEFRAAEELQKYLQAVSGAWIDRTTFPGAYYRANEDAPETVEIVLGTLDNSRRLLPPDVRDFLAGTEYDDAYGLATTVDADGWRSLFIVGKTDAGVLYGTYAFLEDYVGCRFFHALPGGEHVPKRRTLELPDIHEFRQPWVKYRMVSDGNAASLAPCGMAEFNVYLAKRAFSSMTYQFCYNDRNRLEQDEGALSNRINEGGGHAMFEQAVPQSLFETHPEYFPMRDGRRQMGTNLWQRCLANPDVQERVFEFALRFLAYPGTSFNIMFADSNNGWCECDACRQLGIGDNGEFQVTNRAHRFITKMADRILAVKPDAKLLFFSYWDYEAIPDVADLHYDSRLVNVFCPFVRRCVAHSLNAPCNDFSRKEFAAWARRTPSMGLFEYYCHTGSPYAPLESTVAEDMAVYRQATGGRLEYWIDDCTGKPMVIHANWQLYYVLGKLMWNPELKTEAILADAYAHYYGPAAPIMAEYHDLRRKVWAADPEKTGHSCCFSPNRLGKCLDAVPGSREKLAELLDRALDAAKDEPVLRQRIGYDQDFLKRFWLQDAEEPQS